ncbi:MAG: DNA mismatch repair protein MutS [Chloroflexi bacterium]|nr:DNA mismatch repair protein MutS [Chloroflexota bacterium]
MRERASAPTYGDLVTQYLELRRENPGVVILFRVGSFFEAFFDDAELLAHELGLKLSSRPSGGTAEPVPQCGFAHHALDSYLGRLLARGYRVAVCEEGEADEGPVRGRRVAHTLTPGTVSDPHLLRDDRPNYLAALWGEGETFGLAWADVSTGEFQVAECDRELASAELARLKPAELLRPRGDAALAALAADYVGPELDPAEFDPDRIRQSFPSTPLAELPRAAAAAGAVLGYLRGAQRADETLPFEGVTVADAEDAMVLDAATQRHLELTETAQGASEGSLFWALDRTVSGMGRRMLREWVTRPLRDLGKIGTRQRILAELLENDDLRRALVPVLQALPDLDRAAGRLAAARAAPEEVRALGTALRELPKLTSLTAGCRSRFLRQLGPLSPELVELAELALRAFGEEGRKLREGFDPRYDALAGELAAAEASARQHLARLRATPGLEKTRLDRNSAQGFFLEVPVNTRVPADWIRRGGLAKVERYSTAVLDAHAARVAELEAGLAGRARVVLGELRERLRAYAVPLRTLGRFLAAADALRSLALVAAERAWVCPQVDESGAVEIDGGRHPVLERLLGAACVANDVRLGGDGPRLLVLTGPNMSGKSSYMRQVALTALLAQLGSFVPARRARIGLVDRVFGRMGATDDTAAGRSTFMVEMVETAAILRQATDRSLVLFDEVGRGTSTHDGMALAWAVAEYLVTGPARPRAVFATHYHELAALADRVPAVANVQATVSMGSDEGGELHFTHRILPGAASRSYGIEVARMAGVPEELLTRAREVLAVVEPLSISAQEQLLAGLGHRRTRSGPKPARAGGRRNG